MGGDDLPIRAGLVLPAAEIQERFSASGGPGGQHANKVATRVELRFDIAGSPTLSQLQRQRLLERFGDELRVVADDERSQLRNRALARERLAARLAAALAPPRPPRRSTRPTRGSQQRRLDSKRRRGETKAARRPPSTED